MNTRPTRMVDVSEKDRTLRAAKARGFVALQPGTVARIRSGDLPKGNVIEVARVAGIMAAKRTADILPLCHPLTLTHVAVSLAVEETGVEIVATVRARERTGVEMEALTAVAAAALTVYDMCKQVDRGAVVSEIRLVEKSGGKSGAYVRKEN